MIFSSIEFLFFLPVVFAVYWLLRRHLKWQNLFVVAASYFFYGWWDWRFLFLIAFTSACSFGAGLWIGKCLSDGKPGRARWISAANVVLNLGVLFVFKYYNFFAQSLSDAFTFLGHPLDLRPLRIVLPVGISFYTFQAIGYSIDVFKGKMPAVRDVVAFFAYVSFFPQLVAGPIERASNLIPQFARQRTLSQDDALEGLRQMLWGFFKKMVVADTCAMPVMQVFGDPDLYSGSTVLLAVLLFHFQIYGDFSGYSDIAIGTARLFGIRLMRNFDVPYFSRNIAEYWRRWHISLSNWFRDYVYFPLGGSRLGDAKTVRNMMALFLLSGLWHGAAWTYVIWGGLHAVFTLASRYTGHGGKYAQVVAAGRLLPSWREVGQMLGMTLLLQIGWVFFRNATLHDALHYFSCMAVPSILTIPRFQGFTNVNAIFAIGFILIMMVTEWLHRERAHGLDFGPSVPGWVRGAFCAFLLAFIYWFGVDDAAFIYFQF